MIEAHSPTSEITKFLESLIVEAFEKRNHYAHEVNLMYAYAADNIKHKFLDHVQSKSHEDELSCYAVFESEYWKWKYNTPWWEKLFTSAPPDDVNQKRRDAIWNMIQNEVEEYYDFVDGDGMDVLENYDKHLLRKIYRFHYHDGPDDIKDRICEIIKTEIPDAIDLFNKCEAIDNLSDQLKTVLEKVTTHEYNSITLGNDVLGMINNLQKIM